MNEGMNGGTEGSDAPRQLDLFASTEPGADAGDPSLMPAGVTLLTGVAEGEGEGQDVAVTPLSSGNVLPFQLFLPTQTLPQDPAQMAGTEGGWQGLTLSSASADSDTSASDSAGIDPLASGQWAFTHPALLSSAPNQPEGLTDASVISSLAGTTATTGAALPQSAADVATAAMMTAPAVTTGESSGDLALTNAAASGLADTPPDSTLPAPATRSGPDGQFVPPGLTQAISQGAKAGVKSAALEGVPGHANGVTAQDAPPEGLDSQWLERIRQFQQTQQGGANPNGSGAYDASTVMDAYLASGEMSQDAGALDADSLFKAVLGDFASGPDALQDKTAGASVSLNSLTGAQVRTTDPALRTYTTMLPQPVNDEGWIDSMGEKIVWLSGRSIQAAEIHLNPAELGPVEVKVQVQNDQTTVTFTVQHASVRELLEANVHRLREMMEGNGVNLRDVQVGADASGQQQAFARNGGEAESGSGRGGGSSWGGADEASDGALTEVGTTTVSSRNVIDFYA